MVTISMFSSFIHNTSSAVALHQDFVRIDNLLLILCHRLIWINRSWKDEDPGQHLCRQQSFVKLAPTVLKVKEGQDKYWS